MSQSDYISYKKMHQEMEEYSITPKKISPILESGKYISYKQYALVNTIVSHKEKYDKYVDPAIPIVFGMEKRCAASAPVVLFCNDTNQRPNRKSVDPNIELVFRKPALQNNSKATRMKWNTILRTNMCNNICNE